MKYHQSTTQFNCGIDLHARQICVCWQTKHAKTNPSISGSGIRGPASAPSWLLPTWFGSCAGALPTGWTRGFTPASGSSEHRLTRRSSKRRVQQQGSNSSAQALSRAKAETGIGALASQPSGPGKEPTRPEQVLSLGARCAKILLYSVWFMEEKCE